MHHLDTAEYFILLALAEEPAHGLGIAEQMIGDSIGGVYLRPSSLYLKLAQLERFGLIERTNHAEVKAHRKSYRLTDFGLRRLADTGRMHERAARLTKQRLGLRY